jgi:hydroxymethylbilane synthase
LGIEVCADRADLLEGLKTLADMPTWLAVTAERTVSRAMGGSCSMPLAAFTRGPESGGAGGMLLQAAWGDPASVETNRITPLVHAQQTAVVNTFAEAEALGEAVAAQLRAGGAVWATNALA